MGILPLLVDGGLVKLTRLRDAMLDEVEAQTTNLGAIAELIAPEQDADDNTADRRQEVLQRLPSLPSRIESLKTEIDEKIRKGEREAFGIEKGFDDRPGDLPSKLTTRSARAAWQRCSQWRGRGRRPMLPDIAPAELARLMPCLSSDERAELDALLTDGHGPETRVIEWIDAQPLETFLLSSIAVAELRAGVALLPVGKRRTAR